MAPRSLMDRRSFLSASALASLSACARPAKTALVPPSVPPNLRPSLAPIRASVDRIFRVTVCLRPFRAAGPRLDVERVGEKTVVHNYGHGGSGWSLSWGSSALAVEKAMSTGEREVAVIGCGALGMTSAILLQRAGAQVTIYAKERPPEVRSARATGSWTPDSRVALTSQAPADFPALWEKMARSSFRMYESYLGLPGNPIEWTDRYSVARNPGPRRRRESAPGELDFAHYSERIDDITPGSEELEPNANPFPGHFVRRTTSLTFNVASYSRQLLNDFFIEGGKLEPVEFGTPNDLARLREKTVINATGYGARALWKDESIVPVRGQIAWLLPQADASYGVMYEGVYVLARRDGIVVQDSGIGEMEGYNVSDETPNRAAAEASVNTVATLFKRMGTVNSAVNNTT